MNAPNNYWRPPQNSQPANYQQPTPYQPTNNWESQPYTNASQSPVANWNRPVFLPPSSVPGRVVNHPQEIRPNEVPMDGTVAMFPLSDYSCIYLKAWGADGNIQTLRFIPEPVQQEQTGPTEFEQLMARLNSIEEKLQNRYNKRSNNPKKEGMTDEQ